MFGRILMKVVWMVLMVVGLTGCQGETELESIGQLIGSFSGLNDLIISLVKIFSTCN